MYDILYFATCSPVSGVQESVIVYGDSETHFYRAEFIRDLLVIASGTFVSNHSDERLSQFINNRYGCFDRGVDNKFVFIDKLPLPDEIF